MKVIDLTHNICAEMPVYPDTEQPIIQKVKTFQMDGYRESKLMMSSHTGTHIDAPAHMLSNGKYLNSLDISYFIGNATIIDLSKENIRLINVDRLKSFVDKIKNVEFLIIRTGWSKYFGNEKYFEDFPSLSEESAKWLAEFKLKGIGIDAISIDDMKSTTFSNHNILMKNNIIIIENLTNLHSIDEEYFTLSILPLKYENADGSPVRAVAIENIK